MRHKVGARLGQQAALVMGMGLAHGVHVRTRYHVECFDRRHRLKWIEDFDNIVVNAGLSRIMVAAVKGQTVALPGYPDGRRLPIVWAASTVYAAGDVVRAVTPGTNNRFFISQIAGTSAATEPVWPTTAGGTVVDNTVTWVEASQWYVGLKGAGAVVAADTMAAHAGWAELTPYSNATRIAYVPGAVTNGSCDNSASVAVFNINATATVAGAFLADLQTKAGTLGTLYGAGDFAASRSVATGDTMNVTITTSVT